MTVNNYVKALLLSAVFKIMVPHNIMASLSSFEALKKKRSMQRRLKTLNINVLFLHDQFSISHCRILFIESTLFISPEKDFNRVSTVSIF